MFELFARHYDNSDKSRFEADLDAKTAAFVMRDPDRRVRGFSTVDLSVQSMGEQKAQVLFSGDTIIDPHYWARNTFALRWIEQAGWEAANRPDLPLIWFLIVKGHRTYRYLPTFARTFYPRPDNPIPSRARVLRDYLARQRFGAKFDSKLGVVRFSETRDCLKPCVASIPESHRRRPEVRFFLERNPGYRRGEELVCLCHLTPDNLRPVGARAFRRGIDLAGRSPGELTRAAPW